VLTVVGCAPELVVVLVEEVVDVAVLELVALAVDETAEV